MSRFYATAIALCLFTLSVAAQTSPENGDAATQVALPDSDVKSVIRLPSDPSNAEADTTTDTVQPSVSVPLTKITFHPVNRRFPLGAKKGCHHSKVSPTVNEKQVISYGNDMLVASGDNSDFQNPVVHGQDPSIHHLHGYRHHHHHHDEDSDSDSDDEEDQPEKEKKFVLKRYHFHGKDHLHGYRHHHHHHDEDSDSDSDDEEDQPEKGKKFVLKRYHFHGKEKELKKKKGCFFKRLRKFLGHYF